MRRLYAAILLGIAVFVTAVLFGQVLGGFYIYNLVSGDNPLISEKDPAPKQETVPAPLTKKVLRLDPIEFYTIQAGIFQNEKDAQSCLRRLGELGLRPFVTRQPPYKIWVGCFSEMDSGRDLAETLKKHGFEAFIGKGLINDRALKFPGDNQFMINSFAPLLGKFHVALLHSLKMFRSPKITQYNRDIWEDMVKKLQDEVGEGIKAIDEILELPESSFYQDELLKLKEKAQTYCADLQNIIISDSDIGVLNTQCQLLELIAAYHNTITQANNKL